MKFSALKSLGHNIADSFASGIGLMIGIYNIDVFGEASAGASGYIEVDFVRGTTTGSTSSPNLRGAVALYRSEALPALCTKHGVDLNEVKTIKARFEMDAAAGRHYTVMVENTHGKHSVDQYVGGARAPLASPPGRADTFAQDGSMKASAPCGPERPVTNGSFRGD